MKITHISTHAINMPMKLDGEVPHVGGIARTALEMLLVCVDTDEGVSGWGESFGHRIWSATRASIDNIIVPACIGRDARDINGLTSTANSRRRRSAKPSIRRTT